MSDHSSQTPSPEHLAELLPQYDIEHFIAQGGMGAVYKGRQISLDRDIAIKILLQEVSESVEFQESFITEAKAMAKLNHPNLLGVFDYGTVEGMSYIVMEYVDGGSLHQAAWNQAIEPTQAVNIVKGICDGLSHAHKNGIVHRDIKPSNILLTPAAEPKVADFGLAHAADSDKPGLMMGTPGYTAPEVFEAPDRAGELADIYSVGVILHQLLTGIDPAGSMLPPSQATNNIRLDAIWRKAANINPAQRYPSTEAMSQDLGKWLDAKGNLLVTGTSAPISVPRQPAPLPARSGGAGVFFKVALICILAGLVVFLYPKFQERTEDIDKGVVIQKGETVTTTPETPVSPPDIISLPPEKGVTPPIPAPIVVDMTKQPEVVVNNIPDLTPNPKPKHQRKPKSEAELSANLPPGDPVLRDKAIDLVLEARKKRDKELYDNANSLRVSIRTLSRDADPKLLSLLEKLKAEIVDNRIPLTNNVKRLTPKAADAFKQSLTKEESIDAKHFADLTKIRDAYVTRLKTAATETSEKEMQQRLLAQAEAANDLDAWTQSLSPEPRTKPEKLGKRSSGSFVGNWDVHESNAVHRWIAHPSGKLEIVGKDWEAVWEVLDDGTLEVRWTGKKPYIMKRDGADWVGKAPFGSPVTFKPGDW
ncbi:MAG: serine/threonine-protein kinase [Verrucomicrobiota bacterium]